MSSVVSTMLTKRRSFALADFLIRSSESPEGESPKVGASARNATIESANRAIIISSHFNKRQIQRRGDRLVKGIASALLI